MEHPISNIQWVDVDKLQANDYNPNVVLKPELSLLALSILKNGWIQPILVTKDYVIIDGFHRHMLTKTNAKVRELTDGKVPVVIMDISEPERMLLTIRINRAKGQHIAIKMHEVICELVNEYQYSIESIAREIGATKAEIELLLRDGVFADLNIPEHKYSKAWYPESAKKAKK